MDQNAPLCRLCLPPALPESLISFRHSLPPSSTYARKAHNTLNQAMRRSAQTLWDGQVLQIGSTSGLHRFQQKWDGKLNEKMSWVVERRKFAFTFPTEVKILTVDARIPRAQNGFGTAAVA